MAYRTVHLSKRPDWECQVCAHPWPCANAKSDLLAEFVIFPSVLMIYLSAQLFDAVSDLTSHGQPVPPDLYDRFLTWARTPIKVPETPPASIRQPVS